MDRNHWNRGSRGKWILPILVLGSLFLALSPALAQSATVEGTVNDWENNPLPGVTVRVINIVSGEEFGTVTGADGTYTLEAPAGQYRFIASLEGYADNSASLSLRSGSSLTRDVVLYPGSITEKVTVTAAKGERPVEELPMVVTVISSEEFDDRRPESPQQAMERVPNMRTFAQDPSRQRPNFRGLGSSRVLLMVDGERLNNSRMTASSDGISPSMIDVSQIEAIEVVGGAASALYGSDAIAGTINIITKAPTRPTEGSLQRAKLTMDYTSNSGNGRQVFSYEHAQQKWATRLMYSEFSNHPWKAGGQGITPANILPVANFALDVASFLGEGDALSFAQGVAIYDYDSTNRIPYGEGDGFNAQADIWWYPSQNHELRFRYLTSQHDNLELAFRGPPTDRLYQNNAYRDLQKFSIGYNGIRLTDWMPRITFQAYKTIFKREAISDNHVIDQGSSWDEDEGGPFLTGGLSTHTQLYDQSTFMDLEAMGMNFNAHFEPFRDAIIIAGLNYIEDKNSDFLFRENLDPMGAVTSSFTSRTVPNVTYEDTGIFAQFEWKPIEFLRLSAGARRDNWKTEAAVTPGYAAGATGDAIRHYLDAMIASPGDLDPTSLPGLANIGNEAISTDNDVTTKNFGITVLTPIGINPYVRWADSYREPDMSARYLVRDFGSPAFALAVIPNLNLKPEEGENIDVGIKVKGKLWRAQVGYFKNELENFMAFATSDFYVDFAAPAGVAPFAMFFQSTNLNKAEIKGFEGVFEAVIPLGQKGSLTPFLSISSIEGTNMSPVDDDVAIIEEYFNRDDTFIRFEGSPNDVPLAGIVPFQWNFNLRYAPLNDKWFVEWEWRHIDEINRIDPGTLVDTEAGQYGPLQSLYGFDKHSIRAGRTWNAAGTRWPVKLLFGIDNVFDELYFDPFQLAPAPGRSFRFGLSIGWDGSSQN